MMRTIFKLFIVTGLIFVVADSSNAQSVLYVNSSAPAGGNGSSWSSAFQSVQKAVNAASSGTEIWVAAGTYHDSVVSNNSNIQLQDGVSLYGGFAGTETSLSQRNWTQHPTILKGDSGTTLLRIPAQAAVPMVISGFQLTGTLAINFFGNASSATISNNVFQSQIGIQGSNVNPVIQFNTFELHETASTAMTLGGAPQILDNTILVQSGGTGAVGIAVSNNSSPVQAVIANNLLQGLGAAILDQSSNPLVTNNTVVGSTTCAICVVSGSPIVANNIVAFNSGKGMYNLSGHAWPEHNNLVYGNGTNYSNVTAGSGDISEDPLFVNKSSDFHLTSTSPAINAGDNSVVQASWVDLNGNARIFGSNVDLGAYELVPSGVQVATPAITPNGGLWSSSPMVTITCATQAAKIYYTMDGTTPTQFSTPYTAPLTAPLPSTLKAVAYGTPSGESGMAVVTFGRTPVLYVNSSAPAGGNGSSWSSAFQSVQKAVNAASSGTEIWVAAGTYHDSVVSNNSNIQLQDGVSLYGGFAGTETSLSQRNWTQHPTILKGDSGTTLMRIPAQAAVPMVISGFQFTGTLAINFFGNASSATISNNVFQSQTGIQGSNVNPVIQFNTFELHETASTAMSLGGAPQILDNIILVQSGGTGAVGIEVSNNSSSVQAVIANNLLQGLGAAIMDQSANPLIANNTVVGATTCGICIVSGTPIVANNIVAFNPGKGLYNLSGHAWPEHNNLVYGNGTNYSNVTAGSGDISEDPLFVNKSSDFHLTSTSPAINAGDNSVVKAGWVDLNGNARIYGSKVDLGAYEFNGTVL